MSDNITINIEEIIEDISVNIDSDPDDIQITIEPNEDISITIDDLRDTVSVNINEQPDDIQINVNEDVPIWGEISGTLSDQSDLQSELDDKSDITHNHNLNDLVEKSYNSLTDKPTIPDELADLADDATHRTVTDTEKSTWNNKQDALGFTPVPDTRQVNGHSLTSDITVSKSDVGLGNADNTSDLNKPISTATQSALDGKEDSLGFTPEDVANKRTSFQVTPDDTHFISEKLAKDTFDTKSDTSHNHNLNDLSEKSYNSLTDKPTIPDELADLADDSTHRVVTDTEKSTWNGKQDALGYTAENVANRLSSFQSTPDDSHYPTEKLLYDNTRGNIIIGQNGNGVYSDGASANYVLCFRYVARANLYIINLGMSVYTGLLNQKILMGIYTNDSGNPGTLLSITNEYIFSADDNRRDLLFTLVTPVSLTKGTIYWLAFVSDQTLYVFGNNSANHAGYSQYYAHTYDSDMPSSISTGGSAWKPKNVFGLT